MNIYMQNSSIVVLEALTNAKDNSLISDATVTATVLDGQGNEVSGISWPITLYPVDGSAGKYIGDIGASIDLTEDADYKLQVSVEAPGADGLQALWTINLTAVNRLAGL